MYERSSSRSACRRWRISVEDPAGVQPYQYLCVGASEISLQPHRVVSGVEEEQRGGSSGQPSHQSSHLLGCDIVGVRFWPDPPGVHWRDPRISLEPESDDELVGPTRDDGLTSRVTRGMVIVTAPRASLSIAAGPDAEVYGIDCGMLLHQTVVEGLLCQQIAQ